MLYHIACPPPLPPPPPRGGGGGGGVSAGVTPLRAVRGGVSVRATTLDDVIRARANHPASSLLGGGTDLVVNIRRGIVAPPVLIDVNHVEELRAIRADA